MSDVQCKTEFYLLQEEIQKQANVLEMGMNGGLKTLLTAMGKEPGSGRENEINLIQNNKKYN